MDVSPIELQDELARKTPLVLLDVREPWEFDVCHLEGSILMPMGSLPQRLGEIDQAAAVVTICHTGARAMQAARYLQANGIPNVRRLVGGVEGWALNVDRAMARY